ncbi:2-acylglycerol O-acyltransferase 3 [Chionomys nivalis]|uniref:2-acylglycerol O-acyltransferase 3 n=1 Tax=Chionomys nivalis TaxID=269649 RepID=UPI0025974E42|nr:2-acylglycerol O-acyltransferase 3 [Chionomys nivalis]
MRDLQTDYIVSACLPAHVSGSSCPLACMSEMKVSGSRIVRDLRAKVICSLKITPPNLHPLFPGSWSPGDTKSLEPLSPHPLSSLTMKTPQKQRLEVIGAYQYVVTFLFMGLSCTLLVFFLHFTGLWSFSVLYFVWLYLDWNTPIQGGRHSRWMRKWTIWKHQRDYFPIKLLKMPELPADRNYVLGAHPHRIMSTGIFCNFPTDSNAFSQVFPRLRPWVATLAGLFYLPDLPLYRDHLMFNGLCPVSRQSLDFILSQPQLGQAVTILIGGTQEVLYAVPGEHCITLRTRKGFVRLVLRHGASLVPVYSFGENDICRIKSFDQNSWQRRCQIAFKRLTGFSPCIFWGCSLFSANLWGLVPFAQPITTVVGRPIPVPQSLKPTEDQVDCYHWLYMKALERLFADHKEACGVPASTHLTFL